MIDNSQRTSRGPRTRRAFLTLSTPQGGGKEPAGIHRLWSQRLELEARNEALKAENDRLEKQVARLTRFVDDLLEATSIESEKPESPRGTTRRVLIIEDNLDVAESLAHVLAIGGHEVRIAHDGPAGLRLARTFWPEIVLCDIGMPGMDGYEVARAFRGDESLRGVYLVALSGYGGLEDRRGAAIAGFDQHITKPHGPDVIERLLAEAPVGR